MPMTRAGVRILSIPARWSRSTGAKDGSMTRSRYCSSRRGMGSGAKGSLVCDIEISAGRLRHLSSLQLSHPPQSLRPNHPIPFEVVLALKQARGLVRPFAENPVNLQADLANRVEIPLPLHHSFPLRTKHELRPHAHNVGLQGSEESTIADLHATWGDTFRQKLVHHLTCFTSNYTI